MVNYPLLPTIMTAKSDFEIMTHFNMPSQYPDPESSQLQDSVWTGHHQQHPNPGESRSFNNFQDHSHVHCRPDLRRDPLIQQSFQPDSTPELVQSDFRSVHQTLGARKDSDEYNFLAEGGSRSNDILAVDELYADPEFLEFMTRMETFEEEVIHLRKPADGEGDGTVQSLAPQFSSETITASTSPSHGYVRQRIGHPHRRRGPHTGPRKAAEPTPEIKMRLGQANEAYTESRFLEAALLSAEIIRMNAEIYEAWTLLATCFQDRGLFDSALKSLIFAVHLRPKHVSEWIYAAEYALSNSGSHRSKYLMSAQYCYAGAIRADPKNLEARIGKADIYAEREMFSAAIAEYQTVLARSPHDRSVLKKLAEISIEVGEVRPVIEYYKKTISHFRSSLNEIASVLNWTDVDFYITLYEYSSQYDAAIRELKSVARWLLDRDDETFWDEVTVDDREWDIDDSRRVEVSAFSVGKHPSASYGESLPLELRVKLGLYRLQLGQHDEAMLHFKWLDSPDDTSEHKILQYSQLFRQVADQFLQSGFYQDALNFYQPLLKTPEHVDSSLFFQMGKCFRHENALREAEECFERVMKLDEDNIDARMELARICENKGNPEQAFLYINEVMVIRKRQNPIRPRRKYTRRTQNTTKVAEETAEISPTSANIVEPSKPGQVGRLRAHSTVGSRVEHLQNQYSTLIHEQNGMRTGHPLSTQAWMDAAHDLTDDFRSFKTFYPWDKYMRFLGYSEDARVQAKAPLDSDLTVMVGRLSRDLGADVLDKTDAPSIETPADYRGIPFNAWLDIFLEYALCLARSGRSQESYDLCEAAKDAIVFYHSREDMFLIHVCWCMCAVLVNDEEACVAIARFFMKDHQFTTDSYRMFAAVSRICHSPISWYSSGPSQKYILRQIKAMDYSLVDQNRREKYFTDKGSYSAKDENGHPVINNDLDVALLMLYGHILFTGMSYTYALNYFLRANALDSENPMINLSIGLAYIHHALKRQSENRQYGVLQGMTFLLQYYNSRKQADRIEERQEAHFNMARVHHMLGLVHLAVPYYLKVLHGKEDGVEGKYSERDDLAFNAAYNLQTIYVIAGNKELAKQITQEWLVI